MSRIRLLFRPYRRASHSAVGTPYPRPIRGDSLRLEEEPDPPATGTAIALQIRAHLDEVSSGM